MLHEILSNKSLNQGNGEIFTPIFYRIGHKEDRRLLEELLKYQPHIQIFNEIEGQLHELIKLLNPSIKLSFVESKDLIEKHLNGVKIEDYGVWVYYPWSNRLVHLLDEEEFIEVRTNRNHYKITREEKSILARKKVGVIGLSVGQSVALTMAMERSFEEIRIADFDVLELTNLNRIRAGVHNLGYKKAHLVAREIAEIDPYVKITCFSDGITDSNMDAFIHEGGKLDAIIEECDDLKVKINIRLAAKKNLIPVIMDTSDRGMIDIERFDLTPDREIFHGLLSKFDLSKLNSIDSSKRMEIIYAILDDQKISARFHFSIGEIGKTITTWPQLASAVVSGGGNTADVYRRLVLGEAVNSGRYYLDIEDLIQ